MRDWEEVDGEEACVFFFEELVAGGCRAQGVILPGAVELGGLSVGCGVTLVVMGGDGEVRCGGCRRSGIRRRGGVGGSDCAVLQGGLRGLELGRRLGRRVCRWILGMRGFVVEWRGFRG